jgi:hypothetical protein
MITSIIIFRDFFIENIFFYVSSYAQKYRIKSILIKGQAYIFIQILVISGTLINYLNRHCEREIMGLRFRKRSNLNRLFSMKGSGINIRSVLIPRLLSLYPPLLFIFLSPDLPINVNWLNEADIIAKKIAHVKKAGNYSFRGGILLIYWIFSREIIKMCSRYSK